MKILSIMPYNDGGTFNIATPVMKCLREMGHGVTEIICDKGRGLGDLERKLSAYDVAHFWATGDLTHFPEIECPFSVTIHHLPYGYEQGYKNILTQWNPDRIHVVDHFAQRQLGQRGFTSVVYIPQAIDQSRWKPLPVPAEFAIGCLGADNDGLKRFHIVEEAAGRLNIPAYILSNEPWKPFEEVQRLYEKISVYVVASFNDGGPLPPQEALMCGRPVVTTWVGAMPDLISPARNGEFYDGSVAGAAGAIQRIRASYDYYRHNALNTSHWAPEEVADQWERMFLEMADEG